MLDDPFAPVTYRTSGNTPFPHVLALAPLQVTLRDQITAASIVPFASQHCVPRSLLIYLTEQFNFEIANGDTYPFSEMMTVDDFAAYWFQNFGAIMFLGSFSSSDELIEGRDWSKEVLGTFYIKPNYPGRSSHICNAGFLVTPSVRNQGVGRLLGEAYIGWAPKLGYSYSVFNLVYETNIASCRIWDGLGFKRIGRVKAAGNLRSYPGQLIDAIIFGRDLTSEDEDKVCEERFDKIKFYLKYGRYPTGADRSEKSRLRSAATHYRFEPQTDKLLLKGKEVISDPHRQYEITHSAHMEQHGGINKITASITEKYHWVRIKETVSQVIRNCDHCKEIGKSLHTSSSNVSRIAPYSNTSTTATQIQSHNLTTLDSTPLALIDAHNKAYSEMQTLHAHVQSLRNDSSSPVVLTHDSPSDDLGKFEDQQSSTNPSNLSEPVTYCPLDPEIIELRSISDSGRLRSSENHDSVTIDEQDSNFNEDVIENTSLDCILGVGDKDCYEQISNSDKEIGVSLNLAVYTELGIHESASVDSDGVLDLLMGDTPADKDDNQDESLHSGSVLHFSKDDINS